MIYLDASALVKLIAPEPESAALDAWLDAGGADPVTSQLSLTEVARALARAVDPNAAHAVAVLDGLAIRAGRRVVPALPVTPAVLAAAGTLAPPSMRSLGAIHVATAEALGPSLRAFVTYGARQADAARAAGLHVRTPA